MTQYFFSGIFNVAVFILGAVVVWSYGRLKNSSNRIRFIDALHRDIEAAAPLFLDVFCGWLLIFGVASLLECLL
ncbi:hypothetical protein [Escherichia coli]|uniref:hypothetical protein n=1 Tax=Escherichia coli TaxID=562 RepID=UPI0021D50E09|nr:hypothetical protein [Escherichia coli]MCU6909992.1 hypothetical protein [Escherichia coli]